MKRIFGLVLALVMVCAMMMSAHAYMDFIEKVTFASAPATYTKNGSTLTMNSVSLAAGQKCTIIDVRVVAELGNNKALGSVILRPNEYCAFDSNIGDFFLDVGSSRIPIGHVSTLNENELPSTANNAGGVINPAGADILNNTYAGGQQIVQEGDLLIPFTLTKVDTPTTGDASNIALWLAMFGLGAAGIVLLSKKRESEY